MNVQKKERVEDSLERLTGGEEGEKIEDSFDKIEEQYLENWQLFVMRERVCKTKFVGEKDSN